MKKFKYVLFLSVCLFIATNIKANAIGSSLKLNDFNSRYQLQSAENILQVLWQVVQMLILEKLADDCILEDIQKDSDFFNDLGMDSLSFAELITTCEEVFDISIPSETWPSIRTAGDLYMTIYIKIKIIFY